MKKKILSLALILVLMLSIAPVLPTSTPAQAASSYWLSGSGSTSGGSATIKYNKKTKKVTIKGTWGKGSSITKSLGSLLDGKGKTYNKSFKKASGIKTGSFSEDFDYDSKPKLENWGGNFITCSVYIKKGKVSKIIFSAM